MSDSTSGHKVRARVAVNNSSLPTSEIGRVNVAGVLPWSAFTWIDQQEHVPELTWPTSIRTYHQMRTDGQVNGLFLGFTLPIRRYKWVVNPNGARDEVAQLIAEDFGLPLMGQDAEESSRLRDRFSWDDFLRHALLALAYGFYDFELFGEVRSGYFRMLDLAPRPPATISEVNVSDRGELVSIKQAIGTANPVIPANRLVPFTWEREAGNWYGRSLFRHMYKNWLIKDRLLRVDAMKHDRNGLGVPVIEAPPGATGPMMVELDELAQSFRAGDTAGAATPNGARLRLVGTEGSTPDTLASINYHDEAMARSMLMMFIQLGQTKSGARSLGESFIDYFSLAQETIALWFEDTIQQFAIEDMVDWNFGPEEKCPRIEHERNPNPELAITDLTSLVEKGVISVDPALEEFIRSRFLLPDKPDEPSPSAVPGAAPPVAAPAPLPAQPPESTPSQTNGGVPVAAGVRRKSTVTAQVADSLLPLPARTLRRRPYEQEVVAMVDYAQMDTDYFTAREALVGEVRTAQAQQISELQGLIEGAKNNLTKLASVSATPIHANRIQARMVQMANAGANHAIAEAARQGKVVAMPDMANVIGRISSRATATDAVLARSLSEAAARKALSLAGSSKPAAQVAAETAAYLHGLSTQYLQDQLGGALQQSLNSGRREVISSGPSSQIYSSELLDSNTCETCIDVDGTEYPDMDAAEADYPTGGYMDCLGGPRCRGTLIAVYGEES